MNLHPTPSMQAIYFAFNLLRTELSPKLAYHNLWHTAEEVLPGCAQIAQYAGISDEDWALLEVAAVYHDVGYTETYANHELVGARIAAQTLPQYGFRNREIEQVMGMIFATRIPQSPRSLLEEILADADLDVLGRPDFMARNVALRQEWCNYGRETPLEQWYEGQLAFLRNHNYFTPAARMLRNEQKKKNISLLEDKLREIQRSAPSFVENAP
ncbi:MAG TPA: HD domain-containing protein [Anaerolineales bacterium]|nr:HD domain-containing protein [Anaerolineales bacterium]